MKLLTFILAMNTIACYGQHLFVDKIREYPWTSGDEFDPGQVHEAKEIGLSILGAPRDSLKTDMTIWTFKDDLILSHYFSKDKKEEIILRCDYVFDWEKGLLFIQWPEEGRTTYAFTFISTGSFVLLTKKKVNRR